MTMNSAQPLLLKPARQVGIAGYGAYVPRFRLPAREVARIWTGGEAALPIKEKSVPGLDEDVATMSIEAARNALARAGVDPELIRAVWVGSESHPYAVKPTSTIVAEAIGAVPHVQAAPVGSTLEIVNSDPTLHNIHALPKNNAQFNMAQPKQGQKATKTFGKSEVMVKFKCDVHSWMAAYGAVLDHPFYAVSDDKGNFTIKDLPAGDYELEAWHEKYGVQSMKVSVGASDTKTADFTFSGN